MPVSILEKTALSKERNKDRATSYSSLQEDSIICSRHRFDLLTCDSTSVVEDKVDKEALGVYRRAWATMREQTTGIWLPGGQRMSLITWTSGTLSPEFAEWVPQDPWISWIGGFWGIHRGKMTAGLCLLYLRKVTRKGVSGKASYVLSWGTGLPNYKPGNDSNREHYLGFLSK